MVVEMFGSAWCEKCIIMVLFVTSTSSYCTSLSLQALLPSSTIMQPIQGCHFKDVLYVSKVK